MALRYAIDTNVLLRLAQRNHPQHGVIATALRRLVAREVELCFTPQNLGEFWNVSTRAVERNGFGLSIQETDAHVQAIERTMTLLAEDERVYRVWRRLLLSYDVRGVQVHDAHLAATLEVHGVTHLLTFNGEDFKRFPSLIPVHPGEVQP
ncbi:MAG: type II toxin-antitoxin system VapC family toxin [Terriglobia bacterium]